MYKITLINHRNGKVHFNLTVETVTHKMWGEDFKNVSLLIHVGQYTELFDWFSVFSGNGADITVMKDILRKRVDGMIYKYAGK